VRKNNEKKERNKVKNEIVLIKERQEKLRVYMYI